MLLAFPPIPTFPHGGGKEYNRDIHFEKSPKVFPIVRYNSPAISTGVSQHGFVRELLLGFPCVLNS
jgi:hypothetical protein